MLIVIDLGNTNEETVVHDESVAEKLAMEERIKREMWYEWLQRAPRPQLIPVEYDR